MEDKDLQKIIDFIRLFGFTVLLGHVYWHCYGAFEQLGMGSALLSNILSDFNRDTGLFAPLLKSKWMILVVVAGASIGSKGKVSKELTWPMVITTLLSGLTLYLGNWWVLELPLSSLSRLGLYLSSSFGGLFLIMAGVVLIRRLIRVNLMKDPFNEMNEEFAQMDEKRENDDSINLPIRYRYRWKTRTGWINVVNPYRATLVMGTPGSGKSFAVINNYIRQHIEKGFAMYIYDFKFDTLSKIAYNHLLNHRSGYESVGFYVINFDDLSRSHRCNPINTKYMIDIVDAYESAYIIMLNLNKTWAQKQGDFFVESAINFLSSIIWFLNLYQPDPDDPNTKGIYCTLPHAIEFLCQPYQKVLGVLGSYPELSNYAAPFINAMMNNAQDQLQGQIASVQIPLSRISSPQLYWVMTGDDFTLDINNPQEPKILCIGNNPDRQSIYSAPLGLYNSRLIKLINKKGRRKCSVIIDELPTIFFRGLDNLIATARSNLISVCVGIQDYSQLIRDYGDKEAQVIINTIGNLFSGQVIGDTAKKLSERFGQIHQMKESVSTNRNDTSVSLSTQMASLIPASKIASLSQGKFVGAVVDNFGEEIEQKTFHAQIVVDVKQLKNEEKSYVDIPVITDFTDHKGNDRMKEIITTNYHRVKSEITELIASECERIENDSQLKHLVFWETEE